MLGLSTSVHRGETRRGEATHQLGLGYRTSSLTEETRGAPGPVRAADRAPDGTVKGVRLFDAFRGPHWTLLTADTDAAQGYGAGVFLIRPDGYVGWAGDTRTGWQSTRSGWEPRERTGSRSGLRKRGGATDGR